ncbi:DUF3310 domain-containing protein [Stutzerimonas chloritidismutans]|uniref:DUF3310 domain-containing protein n=1 Tax=Stutzerimonas chloritidismutans TaxID=203192 RepID=UPI003F5CD52A
MSTFSLTKGSEAALGMLARHAGTETLLLTQPARELRASLTIEPFTSLGGGMLMAELYMREQRHSMTLQRDDGANSQHLADWIEAVANGTVDTAEAIPQRTEPGDLAAATAAFTAAALALNAEADMVNHPPHYTGHPSGVECIEVAEHLPFCLGNAFKYLFRRDAKGNPLENIEKAIWYVNRHNETYPEKPELPEDAREALGMVVVHEPHPFSTAMLLIASPSQCGGYDACITMLEQEAARLRSGAEPLRAA